MINCIIVEDETLAQNVIQSHLQKFPLFNLVSICSNAPEAKNVLDKKKVDLIFLDIQLPGMTGLNFLKTLSNPPLIVFTTAYADYALDSYEFNVIDYLLKPISFERFSKTTNKIIHGKLAGQNTQYQNDFIFIKSNSRSFKVYFSEIIFIEGMKDYLKIHTKDNVLVTHQTMSEMEKNLPAAKFMRVHKSYIIGLNFIKSVSNNDIHLQNKVIPVGINYKEKITQLFNT